MREYGIVSPMFWIGRTGRLLRSHPYAQRVALYLITSPFSEMTGVFYCPLSSILNDVGSPIEGASKGLQSPIEGVKEALTTLQELNFCCYDFESEFVFVKEMARWQIGESLKEKDNRVVGLRKYVKSMPKPLAARFLERYNNDFCLGFNLEEYSEYLRGNPSPLEAPSKPLERGSMKPLRSQEQEQEQNIYNTNKQQTEVCNEGSAADEACSVAVEEKNCPEVNPEDKPLTSAEIVTACRSFGIDLSSNERIEAIANRKTITSKVLCACVESWKQTGTGTGYFVVALEKASKDPSTVTPHVAVVRTAVAEDRALNIASKLIVDGQFSANLGWKYPSVDVLACDLQKPNCFKQFKPYLSRLGLIGGRQ